MTDSVPLRALALVCSLKASPAPSSSHLMARQVLEQLGKHGFTIPAQGGTYWNDEAMGSRDHLDLDETPEAVASTTVTLAENAAHLARAGGRALPRQLSGAQDLRSSGGERPDGPASAHQT